MHHALASEGPEVPHDDAVFAPTDARAALRDLSREAPEVGGQGRAFVVTVGAEPLRCPIGHVRELTEAPGGEARLHHTHARLLERPQAGA